MNVEELRETTAAKISNRARSSANSNWLMRELDSRPSMPETDQTFLEMTTVSEFIFNSHYPVEGVFCYMISATAWDVIYLLEAGYIQDLCVRFHITFPPNYPDSAPSVRVGTPAKLIHPFIHTDSGELDVSALMRDKWNALEHCTAHLLSALKMMLLSPCRQPYPLTADACPVNKEALNDYLTNPNITMNWRSILIDSLRTGNLVEENELSSSTQQELNSVDAYLNDLATGAGLVRLRGQAAKILKDFDATLQSHVNIMLQRLKSPEPVSLLKLTHERVNIILDDLNALMSSDECQSP